MSESDKHCEIVKIDDTRNQTMRDYNSIPFNHKKFSKANPADQSPQSSPLSDTKRGKGETGTDTTVAVTDTTISSAGTGKKSFVHTESHSSAIGTPIDSHPSHPKSPLRCPVRSPLESPEQLSPVDYSAVNSPKNKKFNFNQNNNTSSTYRKQDIVVHNSTDEDNDISDTPSSPIKRNLSSPEDDTESIIQKLRVALAEGQAKDASSATALARSDAMILELRSSVRQLNTQMDKIKEEKLTAEHERQQAMDKVKEFEMAENDNLQREKVAWGKHQQEQSEMTNARIGELQVELDRAHAQILTADMVRKELEDTLEAEQYTWELRVQDQERTIQQSQQELVTLSADLEACRRQWKEAEEGWTVEIKDLQAAADKAQQEARHWKSMQRMDTSEVEQLKEKLITLELGRTELQACLDEALKELEAVDAELQQGGNNNVSASATSDIEAEATALREENEKLERMLLEQERENQNVQDKNESPHVLESLQHIYRLLREQDGVEEGVHDNGGDALHVLAAIQSFLEKKSEVSAVSKSSNNDSSDAAARKRIVQLEAQLSAYKVDRTARDESSAELKARLKEALDLLKPLQQAAAKADREKARLQDRYDAMQSNVKDRESKINQDVKKWREQIVQRETEVDQLNQRIESLEIELSKAKLASTESLMNSPNINSDTPSPGMSKAREKLRRKRQEEKNIQGLLKDAQMRLTSPNKQNAEAEAVYSELLKSPENVTQHDDMELTMKNTELNDLKQKLDKKNEELKHAHRELEKLRNASVGKAEGNESRMKEAQARERELEVTLAKTRTQLKTKKSSEKVLNRSLKEALGLLRPMQVHLENAEREKKMLRKRIRALREAGTNDDGNGDPAGTVATKFASALGHPETERAVIEMRKTIKQLEKENSQLHNALDEMSQARSTSHVTALSGGTNVSQRKEERLREDVVELKSRYDVTQSRLENSLVENQAMTLALKKKVQEKNKLGQEFHRLKELLQKTEAELENTKFVATSALVKVEELTMANMSLNNGSSHAKTTQIVREHNKKAAIGAQP